MVLQEICRRVLGRFDLMKSSRLPLLKLFLAGWVVFMTIWKVAGMPPGINGDWWDLFDDVVVLPGLLLAAIVLLERRR